MKNMRAHRRGTQIAAIALVLVAAAPALAPAAGSAAPSVPTGGAAIGGLDPTHHPARKTPGPPTTTAKGRWLARVTITEYWPAPESWFVGRLVSAPGLPGEHRIDWLYSATGVSMQGEGLGLDGQIYHIDAPGDGGWVTAEGRSTKASRAWKGGTPYWRAGAYWRNRSGAVTFPLQAGGWSDGPGRRYVPLRGVTFAPGASLPLTPYGSVAVDPNVIPLGSRVYIPAYRADGHGGWFIAQDTGGAITGHRIDVYRTPPVSPGDPGQYLAGQRILVLEPK